MLSNKTLHLHLCFVRTGTTFCHGTHTARAFNPFFLQNEVFAFKNITNPPTITMCLFNNIELVSIAPTGFVSLKYYTGTKTMFFLTKY